MAGTLGRMERKSAKPQVEGKTLGSVMKDVNPNGTNGTNAPRRVTFANVKIPLKTGPKRVFPGRKF